MQTTTYNFDEQIDRSGTESAKWEWFGDALPLWVAEMDFRSPEPVLQALHERVEHGVFGYPMDSPAFRELVAERMQQRYGWDVNVDDVTAMPGLVSALNLAMNIFCGADGEVLIQSPIYPPFIKVPEYNRLPINMAELTLNRDGSHIDYELDFDAFEAAITPNTRIFILCNPHNPIGKVYTRPELERIAEICLKHDLIICSDEIHSDLLLGDAKHIPIATLSPEVAERTLTLVAPSKTFNIAGLATGALIATNPDLLQKIKAGYWGTGLHMNVLGFSAGIAAYRSGQAWLDALLPYLTANRDLVTQAVAERFSDVAVTKPDGTYLAWLDFRETPIADNPHKFFLEEAKVVVNDGSMFGPAGQGFVRLNFASPRAMVQEGLDRMADALATL